jgi:hypothetical protein
MGGYNISQFRSLNAFGDVTTSGNYFLDNFDGTSYNPLFWTQTAGLASRVSVSGGVMTITGTNNDVTISPTSAVPQLSPGMYCEMRVYMPGSALSSISFGFGPLYVYTVWNGGSGLYISNNGGAGQYYGSGYINWLTLRFKYTTSTTIVLDINAGTDVRTATVNGESYTMLPFRAYDNNYSVQVDYVQFKLLSNQFLTVGNLTSDSSNNVSLNSTVSNLLLNSAGSVGIGTVTPSSSYKLDVAGNVRTRQLEYKIITTDVSGTSLTLTSANSGGVWRLTNIAFSALTLPTLTSADVGTFFKLFNSISSNLSITITGTSDITSPYTLSGGSEVDIYWNGSNYYAIRNVDSAATGGTTPDLAVVETSATSLDFSTNTSTTWNEYYYITNSGFNALTLPSATTTSTAGKFWVLRNSTSSTLSITLTNTLTLTSPLYIPPSNSATLVISGVSNNTILLF